MISCVKCFAKMSIAVLCLLEEILFLQLTDNNKCAWNFSQIWIHIYGVLKRNDPYTWRTEPIFIDMYNTELNLAPSHDVWTQIKNYGSGEINWGLI